MKGECDIPVCRENRVAMQTEHLPIGVERRYQSGAARAFAAVGLHALTLGFTLSEMAMW